MRQSLISSELYRILVTFVCCLVESGVALRTHSLFLSIGKNGPPYPPQSLNPIFLYSPQVPEKGSTGSTLLAAVGFEKVL